MANCTDYNCDTPLAPQLLNDCNETRAGGIRELILLSCDHGITDPSSAAEINTALAANNAVLFTQMMVGMDTPSPITGENLVSCNTESVVNYDRQITIVDGNVNDTEIAAWNTMNASTGKVLGGIILWDGCGNDTGKVFWIDDAVQVEGGMMIPNNDDANQKFDLTGKWRSKGDPRIYAEPAGIFGQ